MAYDILFLAGRIIVGLFYVTSGINHFRNLKMMVAYAKSKKVPLPGLAVPTTGLMLLAGGASVLLGLYPAVGSAIIVLFLLPVSHRGDLLLLTGALSWTVFAILSKELFEKTIFSIVFFVTRIFST